MLACTCNTTSQGCGGGLRVETVIGMMSLIMTRYLGSPRPGTSCRQPNVPFIYYPWQPWGQDKLLGGSVWACPFQDSTVTTLENPMILH